MAWSIISLNNLDEFERHYPIFYDFDREYIIYSNDVYAFLPRHFYHMYPHDHVTLFQDTSFKAKFANIEFTGELRSGQSEMMSSVLGVNKIQGIIKAYPGFGKTISACYISSKFKKKTLIILDNSKLMEQWIEAYSSFTNISKDDIGLIKGTKMEVDKPVVIAMVQTLLSKIKRSFIDSYKIIREAGFDTVFYDECHKTSSASKYATSALFVNASNVIGLSATPYHTDLAQILMKTTIGPVVYETKAYELSPIMYFIKYRSGLPQNTISRMHYFKDFIKQKSYYDKVIVDSEKYLYLIHTLVKKLINAKHQVFIVCATVKQVTTIHDMLSSVGISSDMLYSKDTDVDATAKVICATYSYAGTGFDLKSLSSLIYASPYKGRKSLIQTIGRILRRSEGKDKAVVFDLIDEDFGKFFKDAIPLKEQILKNEFEDCKFSTIDYSV